MRFAICVLACAVFAGNGSGAAAQPGRADFYVATNGNDGWSGRLPAPNRAGTDGPFATLERARDAIRQRKAAGRFDKPLMVLIRAGTYRLAEPFTLTPADSGTPRNPIVYRAYPGEKPVISGGVRITGWKRGDDELWSATVAGTSGGAARFRQLFVNGKRARRARSPNEGYYILTGLIKPEDRKDPVNRTGFRFAPGDIRGGWTNLDDVEVVKLFRWSETRMVISRVDEAGAAVVFTGVTGPDPRLFDWSGGRYYVENVFEGLDQPGEWYLNRSRGVVYYRPLPGEDMTRAEVVAPAIGQLVRFEGDVAAGRFVEFITLRGLTFHHCGWSLPKTGYPETQAAVHIPGQNPAEGYPAGAIQAEGAIACGLEDCQIAHVGTYGIEFGRGCKDNRIAGNHIHDLGAGGIKIGEPVNRPDDVDEASGTLISDNVIHDGGHVYLGAVGIWIGQSSGNQITQNEIHDLNYSGISVGWTWGCAGNRTKDNLIAFNHLHHLMRKLDDGGGIYLLGFSPGTVIRNNLIHDVLGHGPLGRGLYLDQGSSGIRVENNIVYRTKNSFCAGEGRNVFENNVFAAASTRQIWYSGGPTYGCWPVGDRFVRNIVWYDNPDAALMSLYLINTADEIREAVAESDYNVYFLAGGGEMFIDGYGKTPSLATGSFKQWRELGHDAHSVVADPLFVDPGNGDFTLKPDSPALKLGFKPIDRSTVGPRRSGRIVKKATKPVKMKATLVEQHELGGKGSASQGLALSSEHYFASNASTICRFDTDWNLLAVKTIRLEGVNHLGAIDYHDGTIWGGFLHGPEGGKHDPKRNRSIIARIRAKDLEVEQTWDITADVTWIDPVCFDGTQLWVGDMSDLGIHRYRLTDGELVRDGVFRYPKAMSFSQGVRIVGRKLYSIHTFGSMDGLFEFDIPEGLTEEINHPVRVWDIQETRAHLEGFDFIPGRPNTIWHAQGGQVDRYVLDGLEAGPIPSRE